MWAGDDVFYFPTTGLVVVIDRVAEVRRETSPDDIVLTPLQEGADAFVPTYRRFARGLGRIIPWLAWRDLKRDGLS